MAANVWVTEYEGVIEGALGQLVPVKRWPALKTTQLFVSGEDSSIILDTKTRVIQIYSDTDIHMNLDATADETSEFIKAETPTDRGVSNGDKTLHINSNTITTGTAWTPTDDNGLVDWWNAEDGLGGTASAVTPWTSQGGQETALTGQAGGGDTTSNTLNGETVITTQGSNVEYYEVSGYDLFPDGKGVVVMIVRPGTVDNVNDTILSYILDDGSSLDNEFQFQANVADEFEGIIELTEGADAEATGEDIEATWTLIALEFNKTANTATIYYDGTQVGQSTDYIVNIGTDGTLKLGRNNANTHIMDLQIFGITVSSSPGHRELHEGYWAWAAAGTGADKDFVAALPATHPYKSAAPTT